MNTRKIVLLSLPVILVILIALGGLLYFVINSSNGPAPSEVPAEQVQTEPPAVLTPEGNMPAAADAPVQPAPQDGRPRVIYENQE